MNTFSVKNFERFQHYKDRAPPWIKLYNELLDDYDFGRLPDASKMHLIAIWLLASRSENKIPLDSEWVARRINANAPVDLQLLVRSGFLIENQELRSVEHVASKPLADCLSRERVEGEREKRQNAAPAAPENPPSDEAEYYRRGKVVLGANAGGLVKNLLEAKNKNIALARAALEQASQKGNAREYIGAIVKGAGSAPEDLRARGEAW